MVGRGRLSARAAGSPHKCDLEFLGEPPDKLARDRGLRNLCGEPFLDCGCSLDGEGEADQLLRFNALAKLASCVFDRTLWRGLRLIPLGVAGLLVSMGSRSQGL